MPSVFRISAAHMEAFSQQQRKRFEDEMATFLRKAYPAETAAWTEDNLRELIREGIDRAESYDINIEHDVARYIELMVVAGPDFDGDRKSPTPWAKEILARRELSAPERLDRVYEPLAFGAAVDLPRPRPQSVPLHRLCQRAVEWADQALADAHPGLGGRRPTLDPADDPYRRAWLAAYQEAEEEV